MKTLSYQHRFPTRTQAVFFSLLVCALFTLCRPLESLATVRVASVFADNMVLQQNAKIPIWGWASPKEMVQVELNGIRQSAPTNEHGVWRVELPPMTAGGPYELIVRGDNKIVFKDVYLGEVWLCAGQSNVTFPLKRAEDSQKEISTSTYPQLRFLTIPPKSEATPLNDFVAKWEVCSPKTSPSVSAIAYFFGQYLHEKLQVPVGVVTAAWSGSTCEAWISRDALAKFPELEPLLDEERNQKVTPGQRTGALYNGMIAPITPFAIRGVIWYQGESNANRAWQYRTLFPLLIACWREEWGRGDFPFYYVQLPNFMKSKDRPSASAWAELREAQHKTLSARNVGEAVTIDVGSADDMLPKNKRVVGVRLANLALAKTYQQTVPCSGPEFRSMKIVDGQAVLTFTNTDGGLKTGENAQSDASHLRGFAIAGADRVFHWAEATIIDEETVVVSCPEVETPVAVRYAWADNPICNLVNGADLPASPFRTDDWAGVTVNSH